MRERAARTVPALGRRFHPPCRSAASRRARLAAASRLARAALALTMLLAAVPALPAPTPAFASPGLALASTSALPGSLVIDYAGGFSASSLARLKAGGVGVVLRYVADAKWKSLTHSEANALRANGIDIACVYESKASWMLGGRSAGVAAAKKARAAIVKLGGPKQPFVWFACDVDTHNYAAVNACLAGAASVLGGPRYVGVYGSYSVCDSALRSGYATKAWQTEAWSQGQVLPACAIYQPAHRVNGSLGLDYDTAFMRAEDVGQWGYVQPGSTWTTRAASTDATLTALRFTGALGSGAAGVALDADGGVERTGDAGATWGTAAAPLGEELRGVDFSDDATGCAVGDGGRVLRTTDGGASWSAVGSATSAGLRAITFAGTAGGSAAATAVAVGEGGTVVRSANAGATWSLLGHPTAATLTAVDFVSANTGWAVGEGGTVLRTTNGGNSWTAQSVPTTVALTSVHFLDGNFGWAAGERGTILRTINGGYSWKLQSTATTATLNAVRFTDTQSGWSVGEGGTVLRTVDAGLTWVRQSCPSTATLTGLWPTGATTAWIGGAGGTLLRATATGGSPFGSIAGVVTDAKTGAGLSHMTVTLGSRLAAPTASDGTYVIARVKPGAQDLTFSNPLYIAHTNSAVPFAAGVRGRLSDALTPKTATSLSAPAISLPGTSTPGHVTTVTVTLSPPAATTQGVTTLSGWHLDKTIVTKKVKVTVTVKGKLKKQTKTVKKKFVVWVWRLKFQAAMTPSASGVQTFRRKLGAGSWRMHASYPGSWKYLPSSSATVSFVAR